MTAGGRRAGKTATMIEHIEELQAMRKADVALVISPGALTPELRAACESRGVEIHERKDLKPDTFYVLDLKELARLPEKPDLFPSPWPQEKKAQEESA